MSVSFSMKIQGKNVNSNLRDAQLPELLTRATSLNMFGAKVDELTAEGVNAIKAFGFATDAVVKEATNGNVYMSFAKPEMKWSALKPVK